MLTVDDGAVVKGADGGPDHASAPEALAFLRSLKLLNFILHVLKKVEEIRVPLFLAETSVGCVEGGAHVDVEGSIVEQRLAHLADELAEDGFVVDDGAENGEAGQELAPCLVWTFVLLESLIWSDRCAESNPLDEALATTVREAVCCFY